MYAVVGCNACNALWVVEGRPETTGCPRCGKRHRYKKLKKFVTRDTASAAKNARSRLLADRDGDHAVDDFETLGREAMAAGMDEETYLEKAGVDPEAVADAGERAESSSAVRSRLDVVRDAVREGAATADEVADYAATNGVDPEWAREALDRLTRRGEVTESEGEYRLL